MIAWDPEENVLKETFTKKSNDNQYPVRKYTFGKHLILQNIRNAIHVVSNLKSKLAFN